jgi:cell division protein FtsL
MDLDANSLLASLLVSSIGFVAFVYGKRQSRYPHMLAGVLLSVFPYFVSNVPLMLGIAVVLCAGLWGAVRLGW